MKKIWRRGMPFSPDVAPLVSRMPAVDEYRESLLRLQGVWDSLSMLGQMSGTLPDIGATRAAFQSLSEDLLDSLGRSLLTNVAQRMRSQAQVAIDILVRNLFERTADIGFLSTDSQLRDVVRASKDADGADATALRALQARFAEYAAKYTVYDDVIALAPDGRVLARLDDSIDGRTAGREPWLAQALQGGPYVEHFGESALMGGRRTLLYAAAIRVDERIEGVLCLSFRFDDEMGAIFSQLLEPRDRGVIVLADARGTVLSSSDPWQVPVGAPLPPALPRGADAQPPHQLARFAGREYLMVHAAATGYEGYMGPGWSARALVPVDQAFDTTELQDALQGAADADDLLARLDTRELFGEALRTIPAQARHIQRDLSRVLWNGRLRPTGDGTSNAFAATLLREVGQTGERIRQVFEQAIANLHRSTLNAVFDEARHHARLAIDIVDRNLYERANDCRWWALDGVLRGVLSQPAGQRDAARAAAVLQRINGLYTVYALLVLFDIDGRIVAVSDPAEQARCGELLDAPWVRETLALRDPQQHVESAHAASALYGGRPTFVHGAALRAPTGAADGTAAVVGGIAIVFDGEPQFAAMLRDALPLDAQGEPSHAAAALLVTRAGTVVASSDVARWPVGSGWSVPADWQPLARGASASTVIHLDGVAWSAGCSVSGGYREYHADGSVGPHDLLSVALLKLGAVQAHAPAAPLVFDNAAAPPRGKEPLLSIASFLCAGQWLGVPSATALQALQPSRIAALPNAPAHLLGMLEFEGRLLPVVDLGVLRGTGAATDPQAPLVVAQGSLGRRFVMRVDELGPVFEVASSRVQSLARPGGAQERLVSSHQRMLILMDVDGLVAQAGIAALAIAEAALA
jgi:chemotaxis signal transduction protein